MHHRRRHLLQALGACELVGVGEQIALERRGLRRQIGDQLRLGFGNMQKIGRRAQAPRPPSPWRCRTWCSPRESSPRGNKYRRARSVRKSGEASPPAQNDIRPPSARAWDASRARPEKRVRCGSLPPFSTPPQSAASNTRNAAARKCWPEASSEHRPATPPSRQRRERQPRTMESARARV